MKWRHGATQNTQVGHTAILKTEYSVGQILNGDKFRPR